MQTQQNPYMQVPQGHNPYTQGTQQSAPYVQGAQQGAPYVQEAQQSAPYVQALAVKPEWDGSRYPVNGDDEDDDRSPQKATDQCWIWIWILANVGLLAYTGFASRELHKFLQDNDTTDEVKETLRLVFSYAAGNVFHTPFWLALIANVGIAFGLSVGLLQLVRYHGHAIAKIVIYFGWALLLGYFLLLWLLGAYLSGDYDPTPIFYRMLTYEPSSLKLRDFALSYIGYALKDGGALSIGGISVIFSLYFSIQTAISFPTRVPVMGSFLTTVGRIAGQNSCQLWSVTLLSNIFNGTFTLFQTASMIVNFLYVFQLNLAAASSPPQVVLSRRFPGPPSSTSFPGSKTQLLSWIPCFFVTLVNVWNLKLGFHVLSASYQKLVFVWYSSMHKALKEDDENRDPEDPSTALLGNNDVVVPVVPLSPCKYYWDCWSVHLGSLAMGTGLIAFANTFVSFFCRGDSTGSEARQEATHQVTAADFSPETISTNPFSLVGTVMEIVTRHAEVFVVGKNLSFWSSLKATMIVFRDTGVLALYNLASSATVLSSFKLYSVFLWSVLSSVTTFFIYSWCGKLDNFSKLDFSNSPSASIAQGALTEFFGGFVLYVITTACAMPSLLNGIYLLDSAIICLQICYSQNEEVLRRTDRELCEEIDKASAAVQEDEENANLFQKHQQSNGQGVGNMQSNGQGFGNMQRNGEGYGNVQAMQGYGQQQYQGAYFHAQK